MIAQTKPDDFIAPLCSDEIRILFQDEHILLIDKPSGLLSLSGKNPLNKDSVHFRLVRDFPTATLVHRLDFGTSGIMLVALSKPVNAELTKQFQTGRINKTYSAILHGHVAHDSGEIELPIAKDPPNFPLQKICFVAGKKSLTQYRVIEHIASPPSTRVLFTPASGRTHQLRIHSREFGHPILGCDLYSNSESRAMAARLLLHATSIEFSHPITNERICATSACPF
ncbi:pseudouridine synthase [Cellvibrio sp. OA-2007]|uniref:pseudouridine synthase n=1 Tax=Cellvibrio sp. OA-2007 TaxID=529823 RepID=UPI000AD767B2|nr:pseudouridine synthase [Cellvibrio sp. OA-2007]